MAVTRTVLNNGPKNLMLHVYLESDGSEGELQNFVLVDPTVYDTVITPDILAPNMKLTIQQVWYSASWFDTFLSFDGAAPKPYWVLPRDSEHYYDFRYFGGFADRLVDPQTIKSTDRTGKLLLSTIGYAPAGSIGSMVLEIKKSRD